MKHITGKGYAGFPYQKRPTREKGEKFMKQCIDAAINMASKSENNDLRSSRYDKQINYDLANGIIHEEEMYKITNPFGIEGFDRELQDYPLIKPRLNILIGEEFNRRFDYTVSVTNPDAISEKEKTIKKSYVKLLKDKVLSLDYDEEEMKKELQKLEKWKNYSYLDLRERMASQILKYLWKDLRLQEKFNLGMEDVVIAAEEIYAVEVTNGKLGLRRVNPLNITTIRSNVNSIYFDDADIIIEESYENFGTVIDDYYDELSPTDIKKIEEGAYSSSFIKRGTILNYSTPLPSTLDDVLIDTENLTTLSYTENAPFSTDGRVRKAKVTWRSLRKVGRLETFDDDGRPIKKFVDENYKPNEMMGEKVRWFWITEWWEGTKLADDIYVRMGPKEVQPILGGSSRISGSGYVGTIYTVGSTKARSLFDILRPYQYLYDEFMDRVKQAFAKFKGPMIELDFAKMPEGWEPEKWMHYAENMGYLIVDSFKEGHKGQATGKLAGNFNTTNKVINPDLGNYIQQHIMMLEYIEKQIGIISGINDQRLGEIKASETVGGVERAVTQSAHITERLFKLHDNTKLRVLETLLEYAKVVWRNDKVKMQFVLDDMTSEILELDGRKLSEAEYGIYISDSRSDMELRQSLKQLGSMLVQSGKASISSLMDIYLSGDMASMRAKIEDAEEKAMEQQQQAQQEQIKAQQEQAQMMAQLEQAKMQLEERIAVMNNQTKLAVEAMKQNGGEDGEVKAMELELKARELELKAEEARRQIELKRDEIDKKIALERAKLSEEERSNKAKEAIDRAKPKTTSK
jgi:hypothetical protein